MATAKEPVIALVINGKAKAYPLSVLIWHKIVNDEVGGVPVTVTYSPLCNAGTVFDRRIWGQVLDFSAVTQMVWFWNPISQTFASMAVTLMSVTTVPLGLFCIGANRQMAYRPWPGLLL